MMDELQPGDPQLIGPYRLRGRLGAGGMGRVYLGLSPGGRAVAVKVIRAELAHDPEFRARFRREITVARKVSGLFTAPVIDADLDGPVPWLVTEYVSGPSLADAVTARGPLPVASVLALAMGLAEGLSAIHAAGVVHRDLKPANVLLAGDGPRMIDFGISRAVEASALTHTGLVVGSPGFMSPEQAEGREVGPPSDIFSLGAVLAFAATGQGPFGTGSTPALVYRVVHSLPQLDQVPAEVRPLVERCLVKDPARRPTARDLLSGAAFPAAGWLPEPVTRGFSLAGASPAEAGALTGAGPAAAAAPTEARPAAAAAPTEARPAAAAAPTEARPAAAGTPQPVATTAPALMPPDLPPWGLPAVGGDPAAADRSDERAGLRAGPGASRRPWRGPGGRWRPARGRGPGARWRPLAAAILAGLAGAAVTAGLTMTGGSAPLHAAQSARRGPAQTLTPASAPSSAAPSASYPPASSSAASSSAAASSAGASSPAAPSAGGAASGTSPAAPGYVPPASPPTTAPAQDETASPSASAAASSPAPHGTPSTPAPAPSTSSPAAGGYGY
jgi:eukaryotic-like serine/threonine-protein kinase